MSFDENLQLSSNFLTILHFTRNISYCCSAS